jgi:hypothetical protein
MLLFKCGEYVPHIGDNRSVLHHVVLVLVEHVLQNVSLLLHFQSQEGLHEVSINEICLIKLGRLVDNHLPMEFSLDDL